MFILTKIADLVQVKPDHFKKGSLIAIEDNLNEKYANKVIQKIGLCICLYDILWSSEGLIGHGDGMVNCNVEFRVLVFRPFKGEIFFARITESTPQGIRLRTDFFTDIFVPYDKLPENSVFDPNEKLWVWQVGGPEDNELNGHADPTIKAEGGGEGGDEEEDAEPQHEKMFFDNHEMVRVQVVDEEWHDLSPLGPRAEEAVAAEMGTELVDMEKAKTSPYRVVGSMQGEGLGVCLWWDQPDQEEGEEEGGEEEVL